MHMGDLGKVPGSWLQTGPALVVVVAIWGVSWMMGISVFPLSKLNELIIL